MRIYDRFGFGDLLEISLIDGRQYRSRGACYAPPDKGRAHLETIASCPERLDQSRTMLGAQQESWLFDGFARSTARWNVLAGDVMISQWKQRNAAGETAFWTDDWNGYPAARARLVNRIRDARLSNPVTVCGDVHAYWANDIKLDFETLIAHRGDRVRRYVGVGAPGALRGFCAESTRPTRMSGFSRAASAAMSRSRSHDRR